MGIEKIDKRVQLLLIFFLKKEFLKQFNQLFFMKLDKCPLLITMLCIVASNIQQVLVFVLYSLLSFYERIMPLGKRVRKPQSLSAMGFKSKDYLTF